MPESKQEDADDLAAFGYRQELRRTLGGFSAFAAGFSYLSILTGTTQMFSLGFGAGGPAFFWTWPLVFLGQFLVALCFAELAAHYPLAGSVYQWSKQIGAGIFGWMAGWIYLACLIITLAAVATALQTTLPQISSRFQLVGDLNDRTDAARNAVMLGCALIGFTTLINSLGVGLLVKLNNLGAIAEIVGALLLILLLATHARRGPDVVMDTQGRGEGQKFGYAGPFLAAALMASYVMFGFDTAGSMAEETRQPRRRAPWAILQSLFAAAVFGVLLLLFGMMAVGDLRRPELSLMSGGMAFIVKDTLGKGLGTLFLCDVAFAIIVCALAVHTGATRLMFAMARDNNLPFSRSLAKVFGPTRTPVLPAILAGVMAASLLVVNVNFPKVIEVVTSVAVMWANLAYLLVTIPLLWMRLRGWPWRGEARVRGIFALGPWGLPVNVLAILWGAFVVVNTGWPRPEIYGYAWQLRHGAILFTMAIVIVGAVYYWLSRARKAPDLDHPAA